LTTEASRRGRRVLQPRRLCLTPARSPPLPIPLRCSCPAARHGVGRTSPKRGQVASLGSHFLRFLIPHLARTRIRCLLDGLPARLSYSRNGSNLWVSPNATKRQNAERNKHDTRHAHCPPHSHRDAIQHASGRTEEIQGTVAKEDWYRHHRQQKNAGANKHG
jgi:hypothetical protein